MIKAVQSEFVKPESFENIVQLASFICGTRSALINYLDHQNQWTLFNVGWENKKIPKKDSICQFAIERNDILYIPNTDKDQRLNKIEAVQKDSSIKFYAGSAFTSIDGMTGTLCVIDDKPKELTDKQKNALKTLSSEVEAQLNLISQHQIIQKKNEELEKRKQFLRNSLDIMLVLDSKSLVIKEVHTETEDKFGYTTQKLEGTRFTQYLGSSDFEDGIRQHQKKNELGVFSLGVSFKPQSGDPVFLMLNTSLADGNLYVTGRDITNDNLTDPLLLKDKTLGDGIIENLPGIFCLINKDGKINRINKNLVSVTGHDAKEIENESIFSLISEDQTEFVKKKIKEIFEKDSVHAEYTILSKSGKKIPFLFNGFRHKVENEEFAMLLGLNISEQKNLEQELKNSLDEKEVMMLDIHHRVKNNLAVLSGLLQLESDFGDDSKANDSIFKSIARIKSMATIHEHLYNTKSFSSLSFESYIAKLVEIIESLYHDKSKEIEVHIQSDDMELNINRAIPCALILSELISNSYKHAFNGRKQGQIDVMMSLIGDVVNVTVKDNGVGIDKTKDLEKSSSLGYTLVKMLSKQLDAEYSVTSDDGMKTQLQFKIQ